MLLLFWKSYHQPFKANLDKNVLVPLTSSLYLPGKLDNTEKFLVNVGTGYFVEKVDLIFIYIYIYIYIYFEKFELTFLF